MDQIDDAVAAADPAFAHLTRYARDNPLAIVGGVLIFGILLARFAFLGNPKEDS